MSYDFSPKNVRFSQNHDCPFISFLTHFFTHGSTICYSVHLESEQGPDHAREPLLRLLLLRPRQLLGAEQTELGDGAEGSEVAVNIFHQGVDLNAWDFGPTRTKHGKANHYSFVQVSLGREAVPKLGGVVQPDGDVSDLWFDV